MQIYVFKLLYLHHLFEQSSFHEKGNISSSSNNDKFRDTEIATMLLLYLNDSFSDTQWRQKISQRQIQIFGKKRSLKKMKATPPPHSELVLYHNCIYVTGVNVYDFFLFKLVDKISLNLIKVLLSPSLAKYLQMFSTTLKVMTNKSSLKRTNRCKM